MYKILYIDEEQSARDAFERFVHDEFEYEGIEPFDELGDLVGYILKSSANAIVVDHRLGEFMPNITYQGTEVIEQMKKYNSRFPVFILTAHDSEAMELARDVNYVYPKSAISIRQKELGEGDESKLIDRMRLQIKHYLNEIETAEAAFEELIKKAEHEPLNAGEEEELIELDTFLNEQVGKDLDIPKHLKTRANADKTKELIDVTNKLMAKLSEKQNR
jgi:CheY-like chemotaxis protein